MSSGIKVVSPTKPKRNRRSIATTAQRNASAVASEPAPIRHRPHQPLPSQLLSSSSSIEAHQPLPTAPPQQRAQHVPIEAQPQRNDPSLGKLANIGRVRRQKFDREVSSAESSDQVRFKRGRNAQPPIGGSTSDSESLPMPPPPTRFGGQESDDSSSVGGGAPGAWGGKPPPPIYTHDPLEEETQKAIRKAKLLARIDQLAARGVTKSKTFNYRASEDELTVEVARMEVLAQRSVRIQQGRASFITCIGAMEKGCNMVDDNEMLPFGLKCEMRDFTKATVKDITNYDDCLERGVEAMLGPASNMPWWMELLMILIPSMVTHSMMNRFRKSPEHTNAVLNSNPALRSEVAANLAREAQKSGLQPPQPTNPSATTPPVRMAPPPPTRMAPPPASSAIAASSTVNTRPEPPAPDPRHTAQMQADLERIQAMQRQKREIEAQNDRLRRIEAENQRQQQELATLRAQNTVSNAVDNRPSMQQAPNFPADFSQNGNSTSEEEENLEIVIE